MKFIMEWEEEEEEEKKKKIPLIEDIISVESRNSL